MKPMKPMKPMNLGLPGQRGKQVRPELQVQQALREQPESPVRRGPQELRDQQASQVRQVLQEQPESPARPGPQEHLEQTFR